MALALSMFLNKNIDKKWMEELSTAFILSSTASAADSVLSIIFELIYPGEGIDFYWWVWRVSAAIISTAAMLYCFIELGHYILNKNHRINLAKVLICLVITGCIIVLSLQKLFGG